jgi:hypothetical protein
MTPEIPRLQFDRVRTWVKYGMMAPQRMREILLGARRLFVDETRAPALDPGRGRPPEKDRQLSR